MIIDTPEKLLELIRSLPDSESHIHIWEGVHCVTTEWLIGNFAGRGFDSSSFEDCAAQQIEYLNRHIGHNSMVGTVVTKSGWPNLERVKQYLKPIEEE